MNTEYTTNIPRFFPRVPRKRKGGTVFTFSIVLGAVIASLAGGLGYPVGRVFLIGTALLFIGLSAVVVYLYPKDQNKKDVKPVSPEMGKSLDRLVSDLRTSIDVGSQEKVTKAKLMEAAIKRAIWHPSYRGSIARGEKIGSYSIGVNLPIEQNPDREGMMTIHVHGAKISHPSTLANQILGLSGDLVSANKSKLASLLQEWDHMHSQERMNMLTEIWMLENKQSREEDPQYLGHRQNPFR